MTADEFMQAFRGEFPDLVDEFEDPTWTGLLHLETACLARATAQAMDDGDRDKVRCHFDFVNRMWRFGDDQVQNAIAVSYFENLDLGGKRSWAIAEIPAEVRPVAEDLAISVAEGADDQSRATVGQRVLFRAWDRLPSGGRAGAVPDSAKYLLGWLAGLLVLVPLAYVAPVGISEFSDISQAGLAASVGLGWTVVALLLFRKPSS